MITINRQELKKTLEQVNFRARRLRPLVGDAKGSIPFVASNRQKEVFVKVVTRRTNAADWLFKLWRRLRYRRLEDEVPFISPKQALEHEAYIQQLANGAGVRAPKVIGVVDMGNYRFALIQQMIKGKSLDKVAIRQLSDKVLADIWKQAALLHKARIAHRDLRTANILLDPKKRVWLLDFDFATAGATPKNILRDNIELLASLATLIGPKRSVAAAASQLKARDFHELLPLLRGFMLSATTRRQLKARRPLLLQLRREVKRAGRPAAKPSHKQRAG